MQNSISKNCFMLLILFLWFCCLVQYLPNLCADTLLFDNVLSLCVFAVLFNYYPFQYIVKTVQSWIWSFKNIGALHISSH